MYNALYYYIGMGVQNVVHSNFFSYYYYKYNFLHCQQKYDWQVK